MTVHNVALDPTAGSAQPLLLPILFWLAVAVIALISWFILLRFLSVAWHRRWPRRTNFHVFVWGMYTGVMGLLILGLIETSEFVALYGFVGLFVGWCWVSGKTIDRLSCVPSRG